MTKKSLLSAIALLLALISVVSCGPTTPVEIPDTTAPIEISDTTTALSFDPTIPEGVLVAGPKITSTCAIVYPAGATTLRDAAEKFAKYFMSLIPGSNFTALSQNETAEDEYQIVISTDANIEKCFSVKLDGKTYFVCGNSFSETSSYRVYEWGKFDTFTKLSADFPDGGFRGWGTLMPIKLGSRTRYFWLTFDRQNGSDYKLELRQYLLL